MSYLNPFSKKIKAICKYSGKPRSVLRQESKKTKEISATMTYLGLLRRLVHMNPRLFNKINMKERPRYKIAVLGARGSGRHTLFTQLRRLAQDPLLDADTHGVASEPEALTRFTLASALPLIRMNCLLDAQVLAASCSELDIDPDKHALKERILLAHSWSSTTATSIAQLWSDENVKKTYQRLRATSRDGEQQPGALPYVSSSSPYFLDRVLQYDSHKYIPTVQEYLQAERIARRVIHPAKSARSPPAYLQSYHACGRSPLPKRGGELRVSGPIAPEPKKETESTDSVLYSSNPMDFTRSLSTEIILTLLGWFSRPADLANLARVNKALSDLIPFPALWRDLCSIYFIPEPKRLSYAREHFRSYWASPQMAQPRLQEANIITPDFNMVPPTQFRVVSFGFLEGERRRYLYDRSDEFTALIYMVDVTLAGRALEVVMEDWLDVATHFQTRNRIIFLNKCDLLREEIAAANPNMSAELVEANFEAKLDQIEELLIRNARKVVRRFFTLSVFRTNSLALESAMLSMCAVANAIRWNYQWRQAVL